MQYLKKALISAIICIVSLIGGIYFFVQGQQSNYYGLGCLLFGLGIVCGIVTLIFKIHHDNVTIVIAEEEDPPLFI